MRLQYKDPTLPITLSKSEPAWFRPFRSDYNWEVSRWRMPDVEPVLCPEWSVFWQHVIEVTGDDMYAYVSIARKLGFL